MALCQRLPKADIEKHTTIAAMPPHNSASPPLPFMVGGDVLPMSAFLDMRVTCLHCRGYGEPFQVGMYYSRYRQVCKGKSWDCPFCGGRLEDSAIIFQTVTVVDVL